MSKHDWDIQFHTKKAEQYKHLRAAVRQYLARSVESLSPDAIIALAEELKDYANFQQAEEKRVEEYKALQEQEGDALPIIEAEVKPVTEAV